MGNPMTPSAALLSGMTAWVLVPREPTEAMLEAGRAFASGPVAGNWRELISGIYGKLLAAAPTPPRSGLDAATVERRGIYIASKTAHARRWRILRDKIGYPIISTWIDEAGPGESKDLADLWRRCIAEASTAEVLVLNREGDEVLKGGWIELGAALASGVPVLAVGIEDFTVAHDPRIQHFASIPDVMAFLKPMANGVPFAALARPEPAPAGVTCCVCGKTGLSTEEGDGGHECQLNDGRWTCSMACWEKAASPDNDRADTAKGEELSAAPAAEGASERVGDERLAAIIEGFDGLEHCADIDRLGPVETLSLARELRSRRAAEKSKAVAPTSTLHLSGRIGVPPRVLEHLDLVGAFDDRAIGEAKVELGPTAPLNHELVGNINPDDLEGLTDPAAIARVIKGRLERGALPLVVHGTGVEIGVVHRNIPAAWLGDFRAAILKHFGVHLANISFISDEILFRQRATPPATPSDGEVEAAYEACARVADTCPDSHWGPWVAGHIRALAAARTRGGAA